MYRALTITNKDNIELFISFLNYKIIKKLTIKSYASNKLTSLKRIN